MLLEAKLIDPALGAAVAASRAAGEAFVGFEEGPIAFAPTFKVERSSEPRGRLDRTRDALVRWLDDEGGVRTFARESKLARFEALLAAGEPEAH